MPRQNSISQSHIFHVINRGVLRQEIFHDAQDVGVFLDIVARYKSKFNFEVYHWCIMPNHYHLLSDYSDATLLTKSVGACQQIYAVYYHRKYKTAGKLFQGRFKSQAIEKEAYLFACGRYIERNPVRAGLVVEPWAWEWSSAAFYCLSRPDKIATVNDEFQEFYGDAENYKKWLQDPRNRIEDECLFRSNASIIGSQAYKARHLMRGGHPVQRGRGRPRLVSNE